MNDFVNYYVSGDYLYKGGGVGNRQASASYNGRRRQTFVNENTLTYSKVYAEKRDFSALAGYSHNNSELAVGGRVESSFCGAG